MTATICVAAGKHRHPTWQATVGPALRAARRTGRPMRIYECPHCAGFHMTKLTVWIERKAA